MKYKIKAIYVIIGSPAQGLMFGGIIKNLQLVTNFREDLLQVVWLFLSCSLILKYSQKHLFV